MMDGAGLHRCFGSFFNIFDIELYAWAVCSRATPRNIFWGYTKDYLKRKRNLLAINRSELDDDDLSQASLDWHLPYPDNSEHCI